MKAFTIPQEKGELRLCENASAVGRQAAKFLADTAESAVRGAGFFTVALSGGSTPKLMYQVLAGPEFRNRVPWS